jgi:hypothetical protein
VRWRGSLEVTERSVMVSRFLFGAACICTALSVFGTTPVAAAGVSGTFNTQATVQDGGSQVVVSGSIFCGGETFIWVEVTLTQGSTKGTGHWGRHGCTHIPNPGEMPFSIVVSASSGTFRSGVAQALGSVQERSAFRPHGGGRPHGPGQRFSASLTLTK